MFGDRERPARIAAEQDRAVRRYLRYELYPYSQFYRAHLDRHLNSLARIRGRADLALVPAVAVTDVTEPAALVLSPDEDSVSRWGARSLAARMMVARLSGRTGPLIRSALDPVYKPLLWVLDAPVPLAYSAEDLERLAELGRRWLEAAGLSPGDRIASLLPDGAGLPFWQLHLGCRRAGLALVHLGPRATRKILARWSPDVVVGRRQELAALVEGWGSGRDPGPETVHTLIAVGLRPGAGDAGPLDAFAAGGRRVLGAWAPAGARALWAQCRSGTGVHTWPAVELVEEVDGELLWSSLAWKGSALFRLRTGQGGRLLHGPCPDCGRTSPRVLASQGGRYAGG